MNFKNIYQTNVIFDDIRTTLATLICVAVHTWRGFTTFSKHDDITCRNFDT